MAQESFIPHTPIFSRLNELVTAIQAVRLLMVNHTIILMMTAATILPMSHQLGVFWEKLAVIFLLQSTKIVIGLLVLFRSPLQLLKL